MPLQVSDLTKEQRITLCDQNIDLWVRRMRAEKKTLVVTPSESELQALWDETITPEDIIPKEETE